MNLISCFMVPVMLFLTPGDEAANPWKDKVPAAVTKAENSPTHANFRAALDVAYRADDWRAGVKLARAALKQHPANCSLQGPAARALWRAGAMEEAERVVDAISKDTDDRVGLTAIIEIEMARGRLDRARAAAKRLDKLGPKSALELYYVAGQRMADDQLDDIVPLLRKTAKLVDADNGYPETFLAEALDGLPEFFEAIGTEPFNQIARHGSADMPLVAALGLPYCDAIINGKGPYRLILDTGGSITLSIDDDIAEELGLESLGVASIRGVSGKQDSHQSLIEELRLGEITCRRVMARTFDMPDVMEPLADGIIGMGILQRARVTLDFEHARLVTAPSAATPAPGKRAELRIIGDAKLITPLLVQDEPALALLDSGAGNVVAVSPSRLKKLFPDKDLKPLPAASVGVGEGGSADIYVAPGVDMKFWDRQYEDYAGMGLGVLDSLLSPILGMQTDVLLGMPVFREMKSWTIDYPKRQMWVEWFD